MRPDLDGYRRALGNRRFRWLVLSVAAVGILPAFAWNAIGVPLLSPENRFDDFKVFQHAAARVAVGGDPYGDFIHSAPTDIRNWDTYIYPPLLAWLLQPVAHLGGGGRAALVIGAGLVCLGLALWALVRVLRVRDPQAVMLMALLFAGFFPVMDNFHWGQLNLLLLALTSLWCLGFVDGTRWWGAVALGFGIALKVVQAPLLLAYAAGRHWRALVLALAAAVGFTLLGARWLLEYATQVAPAVGGGSGWMGNISPTGALMRLADPGTFMDRAYTTAPGPKIGGYLVAVAVLVADYLLVRRLVAGRERRLVEVALLVASLPLISPVTEDGHLVLQLLTVCIVAAVAIPKRLARPLLVAGLAIMLMGPANAWYWSLATSGALSYSPWARPVAELPTLGVAANWIAIALAAYELAATTASSQARAWGSTLDAQASSSWADGARATVTPTSR